MSRSLAQRLVIKPGYRVLCLAAPPTLAPLLDPLPAEVALAATPDGEPYDLVLFFAKDQAALAELAPVALAALAEGGLLWAAYPKLSAKTGGDLSRDRGWEALDGWRPIAQIAIDATWSALRFKPRD